MSQAELGKKKHHSDGGDDDDAPQSKSQRAAKHAQQFQKGVKTAKKGAKVGKKAAKVVVPLILVRPYEIEPCVHCGLEDRVPLGAGKGDAEKERKKRKEKSETKKKPIHKKRDERKEEARKAEKEKKRHKAARKEAAKSEKAREAKEAANAQSTEQRLRDEQKRVSEQLRRGLLQLARAERRALDDQIDTLFHRLRHGDLTHIEYLFGVTSARATLVELYSAYLLAFVPAVNAQLGAQLRLSEPQGVNDYQQAAIDEVVTEATEAVAARFGALILEQQLDARHRVEELTLYVLQCGEDIRDAVRLNDAAVVQRYARRIEYVDEATAPLPLLSFVTALHLDYDFVFADTVEEFRQGLGRAHNVGRAVVQQAAARSATTSTESQDGDEFDESETFDTLTEEQSDEDAARYVAPRERLTRATKEVYTRDDLYRHVVSPIAQKPRAMKSFFEQLEMTNFLIDLIILSVSVPRALNTDDVTALNRALEVFQLTTWVGNDQEWRPFYLQDLADRVYRRLQRSVKSHKGDDEESEEAQRSAGEQEEEEDEEDASGEERLRGTMKAEKGTAAVADTGLVREFAEFLFGLVNGQGDKDEKRGEWDPQVKARRNRTIKDTLRTRLLFETQAREIIRVYDAMVSTYAQILSAQQAHMLIEEAIAYDREQATLFAAPPMKKEAGGTKKQEEGEMQVEEPTTAASSTQPKKRATQSSTPLDKLVSKTPQLFERALVYHQIAHSLARLLREHGVLPGYDLRRQDPFLHNEPPITDIVAVSEESSEESSEAGNEGFIERDDEYDPTRAQGRDEAGLI